MKLSPFSTSAAGRRPAGAFTLIEILVVIGIIGILAGLVTGLAPGAARARKVKLVEAEKNKLITMIEAYKEKRGSYPPDNGTNASSKHRETARINQLFYELTGSPVDTSVNPPVYRALDGQNVITANQIKEWFNVDGIANSVEPENFYRQTLRPRQKDRKGSVEPFKPIAGTEDVSLDPNPNIGVMVFVVPVSLDRNPLTGAATGTKYVNSWYYDCSSTNRHNPDTFDLWAVFSIGKDIVTNGNWTQ